MSESPYDPRDVNQDGRIDVRERVRAIISGWHHHPGVRSGKDLSVGERAADRLRNGMGSWTFVFLAIAFMLGWAAANKSVTHFDPYPYILLNLFLSCLAALQGAILLIAAKRQDQVASELAHHDYRTNVESRDLIQTLHSEFSVLKAQHAEQGEILSRLEAVLLEGSR